MKKKIPGIIISVLILYFCSITQYEALLTSLNQEKVNIPIAMEDKNQPDSKVKSSELTETKNLKLYAQSAALIDAANGRVLYEKNGYQEMPMASTTKIMTCIITLEKANLEDVVTISKYASTMPDVQLNVIAGEQYKLEDLLYSLMLESHNDVAVAIAEHVGGSVEGFAKLMNEKARELGCEHTNFVTPNGLDAQGHYTTAVELSRIAGYAIQNPEFIKITNTATHQFSELTKGRGFTVSNKDRFLYMYNGAIGIKTGFTSKAGYCFVGAVKRDGKTFISSVLGSGWPPHKTYKWSDTVGLMDYGVHNYEYRQIFNAEKEFAPALVEDGKENYVELYYTGDISLLMRQGEVVNVVYKVPTAMTAPIKADMAVGSAKYYVGDEFIKEVPILTKTAIEKIDFPFCLDRIKNMFLNFK
ncbi:D-Ala-D-Ala carboxypeptidase [Anaerocolumna cellulosilytica]|uniref:serine-type D-Ala-D-Ala carboxypeptidase n=1 Tax=Anaerocolumna cellulosilytica TaxID=433286 RepID=A0A6S6R0Z7_9FIRM|nr:D-alanyl-D-alanine carboxypeptidase family protein [Anaerocolumna cellulosilytica]MBB5193774.1 D-alanyl-D-alanine carboxypeptidase (penicillin-binding protein 5/6) [Anaerocolumna cellulosilytica]BCJ95009.1 D-Ala-D-Ala carboxypeptidase [Anaerocolumna cellulosilytica]